MELPLPLGEPPGGEPHHVHLLLPALLLLGVPRPRDPCHQGRHGLGLPRLQGAPGPGAAPQHGRLQGQGEAQRGPRAGGQEDRASHPQGQAGHPQQLQVGELQRTFREGTLSDF